MPIEIVPKEVAKPTPWQRILLYILIVLLLIAISSYFILNFYFIKKADQKLSELENKIKAEKSPEHIALENQLKEYQKKIKDFSQLLLNHKRSLNFFDFLEKNTHPKVFFSEVNLDVFHNQANLSGETESFRTLGEQLIILKSAKSVSNLKLSDIKIGKEGKVEFTLKLFLNPSLFTQW